ncbi:transglycosylase domain-containing protein [Acetomicrobium hydrogeniformans]|jgi:penicillin-binding protein 1A|uniref:Penicillin-binding protein, 1A family n=1 Tax=Acetomicrobium hydrogeniformans ATCC BAA-1850 TaxID=592015 RepID=A0A0T5XE71_9BACT|nr:penicillin-binding protein 1A [Acetomicrobium hydrogeniformans]KRT36021.1 penicillin-binding protein, 1A family [Acetomicrobium hydrogeniformans ATCC BAA-1850]
MKKTDKDARKGRFALIVIYGLLFLFSILFIVGAGWALKLSFDLPSSEELIAFDPSLSTVIYDRNGKEIARLFKENRTWVSLEKISPWLIKAVLAAEDDNFYNHRGIDIKGIIRAAWVNLTKKGTFQGGSTITQQLARNLFLSREKTLERKMKEVILAYRMERLYSKDQILEMYLNTVYWGHGTYGIYAASYNYLGKDPLTLTLPEAAMLAGLLPGPEYYTPLRHPDRAKARQSYVLRRMEELGLIASEDVDRALETELSFTQKRQPTLNENPAPYFVSYILFNHLLPKYGPEVVYQGGLKIYTTLDLELQKAAQSAVSKLKSEGALVAIDPNTGEILAMVGGKDFDKSKFNRAVQAYREPGSAFKPIVYTAALSNGIRPVDRALDAPLSFSNGWQPTNYGNKYSGECTLLDALTYSYNTVAVRVAQLIGINEIIETARKMGIESPYLPYDLSIALGSASVTPMELATAYSVFANGGYRIEPFSIKRVVDFRGKTLESKGPNLVSAIDPSIAVSLRSLLMDVVNNGTGRSAKIPDYEVFGKTGTTNEWHDAWFAGGVPGLVCVVYAGHDDHKTLGHGNTGGRVAAPVWKDFMSQAVKIADLQRHFSLAGIIGEKVLQVEICRETGYPASPGCPKGATILLPVDQIPTRNCPYHGDYSSMFLEAYDPNEPKLYLISGDDLLLAEYGMKSPFYASFPRTDEPASKRESFPSPSEIPKPQIVEPKGEPPSEEIKKVPHEPTPEDIEKRYQELLKEYGLVD